MAKKKLPETLYVYEEQGKSYFYANEKKENCAHWGERTLVGEYEL